MKDSITNIAFVVLGLFIAGLILAFRAPIGEKLTDANKWIKELEISPGSGYHQFIEDVTA